MPSLWGEKHGGARVIARISTILSQERLCKFNGASIPAARQASKVRRMRSKMLLSGLGSIDAW
jgi:hypothetical protein